MYKPAVLNVKQMYVLGKIDLNDCNTAKFELICKKCMS